MSHLQDLINTSNLIVPMVGNKYFPYKPSKNDKEVLIIPDTQNKYDPNAMAVYSKRNEKLIQLGFIIKDKCEIVKSKLHNIKNIKLVRSKEKNKENLYYYYLLIKT